MPWEEKLSDPQELRPYIDALVALSTLPARGLPMVRRKSRTASLRARLLLAQTGREEIDRVREMTTEISEQSLRTGQILRRLRDFVTRGGSETHVENVRTMIEEAIAFSRTGFDADGIFRVVQV